MSKEEFRAHSFTHKKVRVSKLNIYKTAEELKTNLMLFVIFISLIICSTFFGH